MSLCESCGWTLSTCVCNPAKANGVALKYKTMRTTTVTRSNSSPTIVRSPRQSVSSSPSVSMPSSIPAAPVLVAQKSAVFRGHSSAPIAASPPSSHPAPPSRAPTTPTAPSSSFGLVSYAAPKVNSLSTELFAPCCQQLGLCARREGPTLVVGNAVQRLNAVGKPDWASVLAQFSYQDCIDVLVQVLRGVEGAVLTAELCKWFLDTELIQDDEHRFQLFFSLLHCLPASNRSLVMLLSEGLSGFPSVAALTLGPALLGLPPALPSGHAFVKFLVGLPAKQLLMESVDGAW
jgi:hypothetical protein